MLIKHELLGSGDVFWLKNKVYKYNQAKHSTER